MEDQLQTPEYLQDVPLPEAEGTQLPRLAMPGDLRKLSITKGSIADQAINIIQHSQEQGLPAYQLKAYAKYLTLLAEEITKRIGDEATDELENAGGEVQLAGMVLTKKSSAGSWEFEHIPEWVEANRKVKEIEAIAKAHYKLSAKAKIGTGPIVMDEEGVVMEPAKFFPGKETINISIPK